MPKKINFNFPTGHMGLYGNFFSEILAYVVENKNVVCQLGNFFGPLVVQHQL